MPNNINDINLRSEEVKDILTAVPRWMIRWGNTLIFCLIIGVLAMTFYIKYPDTIPANAIITTKVPPQKEYAPITGLIDTLLVTDQQVVKANTPLAVMENTANFQDVFLLKSIIDTINVDDRYFNFPSTRYNFLK